MSSQLSLSFPGLMPCTPIEVHRRFGETYSLHLQARRVNHGSKPTTAATALQGKNAWYISLASGCGRQGWGKAETEEAKREGTERKREALNNSYIVSQLRKPDLCFFTSSQSSVVSHLKRLIKMTESGHSSVKMMTIIIINVAFVLFVP
jgi:hypothetical protein